METVIYFSGIKRSKELHLFEINTFCIIIMSLLSQKYSVLSKNKNLLTPNM